MVAASSPPLLPPWEADLRPEQLDRIEEATGRIGRELFARFRADRARIWQRRWWDDRIMAWAMRDERLKVELFRFVDVLPMLPSNEEIAGHLLEYLDRVPNALPWWLRGLLGAGRNTRMTRAILARAARLASSDFARRFIAGSTTEQVLRSARRARRQKQAFTLDILGEAVISEAEAEAYFRAYVDLIENVAPTVNQWPTVEQLDQGVLGPLPRFNLSIKLSALDCHFDAIDPEGVMRRAGERFRQLLRIAKQHQAFINVDMESYDKKDLTLQIFKTILMEDEFRDTADVGIVIQCYLKSALHDLHDLALWARERGTPVWVRIVKGAYWDYETVHARAEHWPIPVFQQKWQSDATFERATRYVMQHIEYLRPALASHNIRSIAHGLATAQVLDLPTNGFEIQMLYGMADVEKRALAERGYRVRVYMPYGELIPGMAYLVRRLLENTSNDSFLRAGHYEQTPVELLLRDPLQVGKQDGNRSRSQRVSPASRG